MKDTKPTFMEAQLEQPNFKEPLFDYQLWVSHWMAESKRVINADAPGVGKTLEALAAAELLGGRTVVLTISAVINEWKDTIKRFLPSDTKVVVIEGSKTQRLAKYDYFQALDKAILLTTYSAILHDDKAFKSLKATTLILDEATAVKNPETKAYSLLDAVTENYTAVFPLTGTPLTLSLADVFWIAKLARVDIPLDYDEDVAQYLDTSVVRAKGTLYTKVNGASTTLPLRHKLEPAMVSRALNDVSEELPDLNFEIVPLLFSEEQEQAFKALKIKANQQAREGKYRPLRIYQDFLQTASSPRLIFKDFSGRSPKEDFLLSFVQTHDKTVVYVKYIEFLKILQEGLKSKGIGSVAISGSQTNDERANAKLSFETQDSVKVMFITGAGRYGLNLQVASSFVFIDLPNSPADVIQYFNRVYRTGQMKDVTVYLAFMEYTVEEDIFRKLYSRQSALDEFMSTSLSSLYRRDSSYTWGFLEKDYASYRQSKR